MVFGKINGLGKGTASEVAEKVVAKAKYIPQALKERTHFQ
jgi:hypothetical protein